jgi:hypothetical protein
VTGPVLAFALAQAARTDDNMMALAAAAAMPRNRDHARRPVFRRGAMYSIICLNQVRVRSLLADPISL